MLILVTELTINPHSARFISRYGCKEYFAHNKELLFYERQKEIIREMELPLHFSEMGLDVSSYCHEIARTAHLSRGCARQLTADEMEEILRECE